MGDLSSRAAIVGILVLVMIAAAGLALLIGRFLQKQRNESDFETVGFGHSKQAKNKKPKKEKISKKKNSKSATELGDDFDDFTAPVPAVSETPQVKNKKQTAPVNKDGFIPIAGFQSQQPPMPPAPPMAAGPTPVGTPTGFGNTNPVSPQPAAPNSSPFGSVQSNQEEDDW